VALKNRLIKDWEDLHSEQIIEEINCLWREQDDYLSPVDLQAQHELWLLKAFAQGKSVHKNLDEMEETYHRCRRGRFQIALVLNNLGAIQAKRQWCKQALELFKDSIKETVVLSIPLKAPFYNYALISQHLHRQRLAYSPEYLSGLDELVQFLLFAEVNKSPEALRDFKIKDSNVSWTEEKIESGYKQVARFGRKWPGHTRGDFCLEKAIFLDPETDLFASFGDVPDDRDRQTAYLLFQKGIDQAERGDYAASIYTLEMATNLDPDFHMEAKEKIQQILEIWRKKGNETITSLIKDKRYDEAVKQIQYLPHERLKRQGDQKLIESLRKQKHYALLQEADESAQRGDVEDARLKYKSLLEEDLDDSLRLYVSSRLMELSK
jgi:hypothetical protein